MIECKKCRAKYPTERLFCGRCMEPLGIRCPICGFINLLDDLVCGICLTELKEQKEIPKEKKVKKNAPALLGALYEEIRLDAEEDVRYAENDEGVSQKDIDDIFGSDDNI